MTTLEGLNMAQMGCYHYVSILNQESKKRVCKRRTNADKKRMKIAADKYNEAATKLGEVINNWDDVHDD